MTIPEKKAILNKCRELNDSINEELEKLARLKSLAVKVTPTLSLMPKSTNGDDRIQSSCEKIELQEQKIDRKIDLLVDLKIHLLYDIAMTVDDEVCMHLLKYRYIDFFSWEDTAYRLKINESTIRGKKHFQALKYLTISEKTQYIAKRLDREHKM